MLKISKFLIIFSSLLILTSCYNVGFDEVTNNFIESFSATEALNEVNIASLTQISTLLDDGKEVGKETKIIEFDKTDDSSIYYHSITTRSGTLLEEYPDEPSYKERVIHKVDNEYKVYLNSDDEVSIESISESQVKTLIQNFFYTQSTSDIYTNGYYYGDSIKINKVYWREFDFDEKNQTLTFTIFNDNTVEDVLINNTFTVNSYGMLLSQETSTREFPGTLEALTSVKANYDKIDIYYDIEELNNEKE